MFKINQYTPKKRYIQNGYECIFDPIRKKLIKLTPEELVRQQFVQYLIKEKQVPKEMIEVEVPLSYFKLNSRSRADIIVYALNQDTRVPILIVECKANKVLLTDHVFNQVYQYEDLLLSNMIAVTNGIDLVVESWNEKTERYNQVSDLPAYKDLVSLRNIDYIDLIPYVYKRRKFKDFNTKPVLNYYENHFSVVNDKNLYPFIMNLSELFWDDNETIPERTFYDLTIIKDLGVRYTAFGNVSGYNWTGDYRSILLKDKKKRNFIVSFIVIDGYLNVAIDNEKSSHNSLQLFINKFVNSNRQAISITHNGTLTLGKSGSVKRAEVLEYVAKIEPSLINEEGEILLGELDNSKQFNWDQQDIQEFIGRLIKYAILRDDFREHKRKQLRRRKTGTKKRG